jgi:hypothetical protein
MGVGGMGPPNSLADGEHIAYFSSSEKLRGSYLRISETRSRFFRCRIRASRFLWLRVGSQIPVVESSIVPAVESSIVPMVESR